MNISELARRLRVTPDELREKLPVLGFSVGRRAIQVDDRSARQIIEAWSELRRKERLTQKIETQKSQDQIRAAQKEKGPQQSVVLPSVVTVREFAGRLELPLPKIMQELMRAGIMASINERIDFDTAAILAEDLGFKATREESTQKADDNVVAIDRVRAAVDEEKKEALKARPPVIVVMGHVDHGKTSLLDAIRSTHVTESEAGGITQHIGAYQVQRKNRKMTFIDTPGHEAFTIMRSRGAKVADIAILVVAADDGVQPQTKEAINIIQSAKLPFVVAINKIDKSDAEPERIKRQLSDLNILPEEWGGKQVMVGVSAKKKTGIDTLLDMVLLTADIEQERLVANPIRNAIGTVIESHKEASSGAVATVLVQSGTLHMGDVLGVNGVHYGKVRNMRDWNGQNVKEAPPSTPVEILGWKAAPSVGDIMEVATDAQTLTHMTAFEMSTRASDDTTSIKTAAPSTETTSDKKQVLNLIIRADVLGSLEAILGMLERVKHEFVGLKVIGKGLGNITDTDVQQAKASNAWILGFNVQAPPAVANLAREEKVDLHFYKIIYKLFNEVLDKLRTMLPAETVRTELGVCEVLAVFKKEDKGWVFGARVSDGKLLANTRVRIQRNGTYIGEGEITKLQSGKSDAKEIRAGQECGVQYKGQTKPEVGDKVEVYKEERQVGDFIIEGVTTK